MKIEEVIELLKKRLSYLSFLRTQAESMGDITRITQLDEEITQTAATLARVESA